MPGPAAKEDTFRRLSVHIFGLVWSLRRWAVELGRDRHIAAGILIATLALLKTRDAGRRSAA